MPEQQPDVKLEERRKQIEACPTPAYHETHRYCPSCPWTENDDKDAVEQLADDIRATLAPRVPGEHHSACSSRSGEECDCYARTSNAAFVALDALLTRLRAAEAVCEAAQQAAILTYDPSKPTAQNDEYQRRAARLNKALTRWQATR